MAYEIKEMSGSIFANKRKEKDAHPDYQGSIKIGGTEYWLSGWKKTTNSGEPWISLAFKPKDSAKLQPQTTPPAAAPQESTPPKATRPDPFDGFPDDTPF